MSILLEPSYPATRGHYSRRELRILALSLGYDGDLFQRAAVRSGEQATFVSEREITRWLNHRILDRDLHRLFNRYTYDYNVQVVKSALHHLKHKTLTFAELATARIAYESQTAEDPLGLSSNKECVLQVLRMVDRVAAPLRVQHIIQGMSRRLQTPGKLKLFEFFDVVATTQHIWSAMEDMEEKEQLQGPPSSSSVTDLCIDLDKCFETPYQQLLKKLDSDYRRKLIKPKRRRCQHHSLHLPASPLPPSHISSRHIQRHPQEKARCITPFIEQSKSQVMLSRNGYSSLEPQQALAVLSRVGKSRPHSTCTTSGHRVLTKSNCESQL